MVKENLAEVERKIADACKRSGRARKDVSLIAVSKTKPASMIEEALNEDILDFGENKVQEITEKYELLSKEIKWHMIGHLQRNKVKYIIDKICMIHSVDSLRLAETIEQEAAKHNLKIPVLIEVNVAKEESKFGISKEETLEFTKKLAKFPHLQVQGLMTIAPFVGNPEENRSIFRDLKNLSVDIEEKNVDNISMGVLSMGMTNDYEVAIEEGATMVRVGTGIFGERNYHIK